MKIHRIYAIVLKLLFTFRHNVNRLVDVFYWPALDLLLWGVTGIYIQKLSPDAGKITAMFISGIVLWILIWRGQHEITLGVLDDLWDKNMINVFGSPLLLEEWLVAFIITGIIKAVISFTFAVLIALLLYGINLLQYGVYLLLLAMILIINGWWVGFLVSGLIIRFGTRIETLAWSFLSLFMPFSAIYYPLAILPGWAQAVARFVPASYVFESGRELLFGRPFPWNYFYMGMGINLVFFVLSYLFLRSSFRSALDRGMAKIY